ncbi:hypothetical protein NMYAN_80027 [Nitrosomonas nitrosa]|uniref:Uncharacterized protein n=1 Tax=Nitrosomonas nitrosa TaxID=52442 RepID=A0A8H9DBB0_9PROT|nr:hypothetical protein NMYAN_80027 [Nitrosomonas nitrosa]
MQFYCFLFIYNMIQIFVLVFWAESLNIRSIEVSKQKLDKLIPSFIRDI